MQPMKLISSLATNTAQEVFVTREISSSSLTEETSILLLFLLANNLFELDEQRQSCHNIHNDNRKLQQLQLSVQNLARQRWPSFLAPCIVLTPDEQRDCCHLRPQVVLVLFCFGLCSLSL